MGVDDPASPGRSGGPGGPGGPGSTGWQTVQLLAEPTRRQVLEAVRGARAACTRDEVASACGISRRLAAFHLDQLADAGLLEVDYARPPGRSGPGAGRPAKRYRWSPVEVAVTLPARRYDLVARVLATGVRETPAAAQAVREAAEAEGRRLGAAALSEGAAESEASDGEGPADGLDAVAARLARLGYEPCRSEGKVRLRNCPFEAAVDVAPELVCGLNERFVSGLVAGLGVQDVETVLAPAPPDCCVGLRLSVD
ncbi:MAG TPA: helix-turn-helix domain-containing protein [Marmoricola sp.]|nr:helix-turn-helix domain-containing protein [Marmoricola sp.]